MKKPKGKKNTSPATIAGMIQKAADLFPQALFLLDRQHKIVLVNNAAQKLTGIDATNLTAQDIKFVLALEDPRTQKQILNLKLPSNELSSLQAKLHAIPYGVTFLPLKYVPYFAAFKPRPFSLAILHPQTTNQTRESTSTTIYLELLGQLTMRIAHDFSNSLTSIMGNAELLEEQLTAIQNTTSNDRLSDAVEALPEIKDIIRKSNEMSQLIQTLQTYAKQPPSTAYVLDINTAIRETIAMARGLLGRKIQIEFLPSENLPLIYMDRLRIDRILLSILISSKSKMPTGGRITIETDEAELDNHFVGQHAGSSEGHFTRLSITDSSKGIGPEDLPHIFELPTNPNSTITDLSLPSVYSILKQSRGYIHVANWHGKGTRFDIYIPQTPPSQSSSIEDDEVLFLKLQRAPEKLQQHKNTPPTNRLILLAEDDAEIQRSITRAVSREGYEIVIASNGNDAVELYKSLTLKDQQPALLIADYGLPGIDGRSLCNTIKSQFTGANVLLTSGYRIEFDQSTNQTDDGVHFLPKPFTPTALITQISKILSKATP
jgi:signal transduction histidine kinase/CheY-like chemotaxis protein